MLGEHGSGRRDSSKATVFNTMLFDVDVCGDDGG